MSLSIKHRFLARLWSNVESWRAGEIDFATFNEYQRDTWQAIRAAGSEVEAAVLQALHGAILPTEAPNERQALQLRAGNRDVLRDARRPYHAQIERISTTNLVLSLAATHPQSRDAEHRQIAAFLYELAADMERRSQMFDAHWTISADAENRKIAIELTGDHELTLAHELVASVLQHHHLR